MPIQSHQNDIPDLPNLTKYVLENLFPVHKDENDRYFYNIIRTVTAPETLSTDKCYKYRVPAPTPLTNLSYRIYGRMELWWLICIVNKIDNPVQLIEAGTVLKVIKTSHIDEILGKIRRSIV
jgi:hypothetical protein